MSKTFRGRRYKTETCYTEEGRAQNFLLHEIENGLDEWETDIEMSSEERQLTYPTTTSITVDGRGT